MNLRLCALGFLAASAASCLADYSPTCVTWPGWTISSSEDLVGDARVTHYSLANMFDGDPRTAWVFKRNPPTKSGNGREDDPQFLREYWGSPYALRIQFPSVRPRGSSDDSDEGRWVDGIDLMNGYAKSLATFRRNNRVTEVAIYEGDAAFGHRPIRTVRLADRMGWHHISLPRKKYQGLTLAFTGILQGADHDLAISELRPTLEGRPLPRLHPKAYLATTGSDCGCGTSFQAVGPGAKILARDDSGEGANFVYDPTGRYVAGMHYVSGREGGTPKLRQLYTWWVVDMRTGRKLHERPFTYFAKLGTGSEPSVIWEGKRLFLVAKSGGHLSQGTSGRARREIFRG